MPKHFAVEEILPYAACGEGEHLFVSLRRSGWNTADVAKELAGALGIKPADVGWGGRKDRQAVTTQTFSIPVPLKNDPDDVMARLSGLPFEILDARRHGNKLKTGHVAANRFRIVLSGVSGASLEKALAIAELIRERGVPNYYGPQRFGLNMRNLDRAADLLASKRNVRGKSAAFMVSALQSALFNAWLVERIRRGGFERMLPGDVARKTDTGGMFVVADVDEADTRFKNSAIVFTGPIYGHKMKQAEAEAADLEQRVLAAFGLDLQAFKPLRAAGSRRAGILRPAELQVEAHPDGLVFSFTLPSGAYATVVMREFMRLPDA